MQLKQKLLEEKIDEEIQREIEKKKVELELKYK